MKKILVLSIGLFLLMLTSCELGNLFSGGAQSQESAILYFSHTIAAADETYDNDALNYKIAITNASFDGIYWSELWVVRDDGSIVKAVPYKVNSDDTTWYMRSANYDGSVKFRSKESMIGKEIYIFYSVAAAE